jgi:hypothetical protein
MHSSETERLKLVCQCPCGCRYRLLATRSIAVQRCVSCRHEVHFGSYMKGKASDDK